MDNNERGTFWNVLKDLHNNDEASIRMLTEVSKRPETLCRFRPVSERSLQELQENKLFFSSANHYDDPFDTYFYINVNKMISDYRKMKRDLLEGNTEFTNKLYQLAKFAGQNPDIFVSMLSNETLDFTQLNKQLIMVRNSIQRRLFSICFCEDPCNETLWLKYAGNYSGFVQIYDFKAQDTYLCGTEKECQNCISTKEHPYIYPVYYSNIKYDATKYASGIWLMEKIEKQNNMELAYLYEYLKATLMWEIERISLIKKKCHEYDQEWRMIRPAIFKQRSFIKMKPSKIIIGLRTPQYERKLITSAATIAGIQEIHELYINDSDELDDRPIKI